jgi:hypothetical protein
MGELMLGLRLRSADWPRACCSLLILSSGMDFVESKKEIVKACIQSQRFRAFKWSDLVF